MLIKTMPASVKALAPADADNAEGIFEAMVSTYDVDDIKDKVEPGAFTKSLAEWAELGDPIPVIWSHQHDDPFAHIGHVIDAEERDGEGLYVKGSLDMDNPTAKQVYRLLKGGRVRNFSFAYDIADGDRDSDGVQHLRELKLWEVGPTLIGMNTATHLLGVKAGRVLSAKNETDLRHAAELISGVLSQLGEQPSESADEGKTSAGDPVKAEGAHDVKTENPVAAASVDALAAVIELKQKEAQHGHAV